MAVVLSNIPSNRVVVRRICVNLFAPARSVYVDRMSVRRTFDIIRVDAQFLESTAFRCSLPPYRIAYMVAPAECRD